MTGLRRKKSHHYRQTLFIDSSHLLTGLISPMQYSRGNFTANEAQAQAITHPPAPMMIIAGAGTGKTTTLLHRIIYLIEQNNISPENILSITYTEKAAEELKMRVVNEVGLTAEMMTVGTFHAFCYSVVKEFAFTPEKQPVLMEEGDGIFLLLDRFDELAPFESKEFPLDPVHAVTKSFIPFFNRIRDELIDPTRQKIPAVEKDNGAQEKTAQLRDLVRIYQIFQSWKRAAGMVDYGDMIQLCWELMQQPHILTKLQNKYQHLIVDEFQDNNYALNTIIGRLAEKHKSITVVGDDDQVIYSFRGASSYNINDFQQRYKDHPNYSEIALVENYRSFQPILDAANAVIANNLRRQPKTLVNPRMNNGQKPDIYFGNTTTQNDNLSLIIDDLLKQGHFYGDIAILCRTRAQAKEAAYQLLQVHLPVSIFLSEYFKLPVIRDILAWCHVVAGGSQIDSAFYRLLNNTIGTDKARNLYKKYSRRDLTNRYLLINQESHTNSTEIDQDIIQLLTMIKRLKNHSKQRKKSAGEMVWEICLTTNLLHTYAARYEYSDWVALANAGDFITRSLEFSRRHYGNNSLKRFLRFMETMQQSNTIPAIEPSHPTHLTAITVQTIHKAKGLEYPAVILPYNQSQRFPLNYRPEKLIDAPPKEWNYNKTSANISAKESHIQEERRLFYVALTRAKKHLVLLAPEKRTSPFIKEIPIELTRRVTMDTNIKENGQDLYKDLRIEYEQRLNAALLQNQFEMARNFIQVLERLMAIAQNTDFTWGTENWEIELQQKLLDKPLPKVPNHPVLSASAIDTYDQCPLKYRLGYIDNVPETASKPQLIFGNIIHKVLEHYHKDKCSSEKEILDLLERFWQPEGFEYESKELSFKEQAVEILKRYYRYTKSFQQDIVETEYQFKFDLEFCSIRGKIDRIDRAGKGYKVIDYKTSRKPIDPKNSLQLAVYCLFLAQQTDQQPGGLPEKASLLFLRDEKLEYSHSFTTAELMDYKEKIRNVVTEIKNRNFNFNKGYHCEWCDYKQLLCPAWEEGN